MPAASHPSHDRFATTRWSMVIKLAGEDSSDAQGALAELAQRYWYPVYAYVRRCGHPADVAHDITRAFLGQLIRRFRETKERPPQGHFRRFLLNELNTFLAADWREAIRSDTGEALQAPPDLEARNQRDNAVAASPEQAYQRSFALEVLIRSLRRLQAEATQTGHLAMYEALQPYLSHEPGPGEYQAVATHLKMPPLALVVALKRLRQRFRELAGQELSDTVNSAEDLLKEQATLLAVLRDIQSPAP
jgi:DNA-directed RNA polymerase specialized sigma24 family protein